MNQGLPSERNEENFIAVVPEPLPNGLGVFGFAVDHRLVVIGDEVIRQDRIRFHIEPSDAKHSDLGRWVNST